MRFIFSYLLFVIGFSLGNAQVDEKYLDSAFSANSEYTSYDVIFEFDKGKLKPESFPFLDTIAAYLLKHDSLAMEVQNHRDSQGSHKYSTDITAKRARSIVEYLISKGVDKSKLVAKGYRDSKPIVTEEQIDHIKSLTGIQAAYAKNRRTVFKIISGGK